MGKKNELIRRVEDIDEKELLASLAGFGETDTPKTPPVNSKTKVEIQKEEEEIEKPVETKKRKQDDSYKSIFLIPKELKSRQCVYIGGDLHRKIVTIVKEIAVKEMTVGAFIDTILRQHLEEHKDEINNLYRRKRDNLL